MIVIVNEVVFSKAVFSHGKCIPFLFLDENIGFLNTDGCVLA